MRLPVLLAFSVAVLGCSSVASSPQKGPASHEASGILMQDETVCAALGAALRNTLR